MTTISGLRYLPTILIISENMIKYFNYPLRKIMVFLCCLLMSFQCFSQMKDNVDLESILNNAIQKAYPACVGVCDLNLPQKEGTSAQFSGVVVSPDGYILTAAHSIISGKKYKVFFPEGKECVALALGRIYDEKKTNLPDVGMMKIIDKGKWQFVEMGYSESLAELEPCISLSYPRRLNQASPSLKLGQVTQVENVSGFIGSTFEMEVGDAGGALFDYHGRVIALHSAVDTTAKVNRNLEIPISLYRKFWTALKQEKTYHDFPEQSDIVGKDPLISVSRKKQ